MLTIIPIQQGKTVKLADNDQLCELVRRLNKTTLRAMQLERKYYEAAGFPTRRYNAEQC